MIFQRHRLLRLRARVIPRSTLRLLAVNSDVIVRSRALPGTFRGGEAGGEDRFVEDGGGGKVDVSFDEFEGVGLGDGFAIEGGGCVRHFVEVYICEEGKVKMRI
jgi:hypothetical protein